MSKKPILYYTPPSPPCCAVLLAAKYLGVDLDLRPMDLTAGEHLRPEFLKLNRLHTVPVLEDNGLAITDSHIICCYLAEKYGSGHNLYSTHAEERMQIDALLFYDASHLYPRARLIVEPIIFLGATEVSQQSVSYMQNSYDGLERVLATQKFLCGDNITIADICCISTVCSIMELAPIDEDKFPNVKKWVEELSKMQFYSELYEKNEHSLYKFIFVKLEENRRKSVK